jgi:hypothetical protein
MVAVDRLFAHLTSARGETTNVDFKSVFDPTSKQDWCEIVKDLVAIANTRGGVVVVGVNDDGTPSKADVSATLALDPAQLTDKIYSYTGVQFCAFNIKEIDHHGYRTAAILIGRSDVPIVFSKPGTYAVAGGKIFQKTAFSQGTVYVRHGAKSEPATTEDLRRFIEYRIERVSRAWRKNIRRIVTAPAGHEVIVGPPVSRIVGDDAATNVRLVDDPTAPASRFVNPDQTHPYRQKELLSELRRRLSGKVKPTAHGVQCARRVHNTDANPNFTYAPKFASRQYSSAFADWLVKQILDDTDFFKKACDEIRRLSRAQRNKKPR